MASPVRQTLVVARHNEDTSWLGQLPDGWQPLLIQTGEDIAPSDGREATSYLLALQRLRPSVRVRDTIGFVQGHPFDHCGDLLERLAQPVKGFVWWGDPHTCDGQGHPHHPGLPVARCHEEWGCGPWPGSVTFAAGAQFAITGRDLKARTAAEYQALADRIMGVPEGAWVAERLWEALLRN